GVGGPTWSVRPWPRRLPSLVTSSTFASSRPRETDFVMDAFTTHTGLVAPLDRVDVDTDQIIPKQFLKSIARTGFEQGLFFDWRQDPEFVLNQPRYQGASILV